MGQSQSGDHGPGGGKKDDKDKKKKYEPPVPTRVGKKKKKTKGPDVASKLPLVTLHIQCWLKLLKLERIKDYLLVEEEFIRNQEQMKPLEEKQEEERSRVDDLRGTLMSVGNLEEIINDNQAIVSTSMDSEHYISILSFVDKDLLEPGCPVLLNYKVHAVIGVLMDDTNPQVTVMKVAKAPQETCADIGALIRPGCIDRKIEFPLPDEKTKEYIFQIHTSRMTLANDVTLDDLIMAKDDLSGADIKAVCIEAGLMALREHRMKVTNEDFKKI
ncbi:hypothetical protein P7K49_017701 [Saguinus oedipus]|uniref:AAA ATPase AAA+ lid domain-containing protein n=1 Tax=Saguinus oedipus TaxID=9490 RepID=A0ABQ9V475_SAGOE|nr:hypothetical protein P7K49_017701 [Saguinus oedipus]